MANHYIVLEIPAWVIAITYNMFIVHDLSLETKRLLLHCVMLGVLLCGMETWVAREGYQSGLKILQNTVMSRTVCLQLPLLCRAAAYLY